jgi:hypothetical protein
MSDLVQRAGGLRDGNYAARARFYRLFEYSGLGDAGRRQRVNGDSELAALRQNRDKVNLNLADALAHPRSAADTILQPGDSLFVPEYLPTVRVSRAVVAPASEPYVAGRDAMEPGPGAEVFVPAKTPKPEGQNWLAILATVASIVASTGSMVIAAR